MHASESARSDIGVAISWFGGGVAALVLAAFLVSTTSGCFGLNCTLIGWNEGLQVQVAPAWQDLASGRYRIKVLADGEPIDLELDRTPAGGYRCVTADAACHVVRNLGAGRELWLQVDYDSLIIWYTDEDGLAGGPSLVAVEVERDGAVLAKETFRPAYTREEINGRGCGVATRATANLSLD